MEPIHTDVWGLNFFVQGKRLCFISRTPQGKEKRFWVDLPPKMLKAITEKINAHVQAKTAAQQLQDKYAEYFT